MAYQKQTFKDNETVLKAEHLDHIEYGIVSSAELDEEHIAHFKNSLGVVLFSIDLSGLGVPLEYGDLVLSAESMTIAEGGSGTFTVKLASAPSVKQTVYLALSDNTKLSVSPASLVFTPDNWATEQTVTLTAAQDEDMKHDTLTINLTSKNVDGKQLVVSVTDDDIPVLVEDGLWFNLNLRGRTADNGEDGDHSLVDSVNGYVCKANNCDFDGETDGFVEDGLKFKPASYFSEQGTINQYNPATYGSIQFFTPNEFYGSTMPSDATQKFNATIEVCMKAWGGSEDAAGFAIVAGYTMLFGFMFASGVNNGSTYYYDTAGTVQQMTHSRMYYVMNDSGELVEAQNYFDFTQVCTYTLTLNETGYVCMYINGKPLRQSDGTAGVQIADFAYYRVWGGGTKYATPSCENNSIGKTSRMVSHIRAYRKALTPDEVKNNADFDISQRSVSDF